MRNIAALGVLSVLGLLAACGQKGPLVLPDAQKHKPVLTNPALPQTGATRLRHRRLRRLHRPHADTKPHADAKPPAAAPDACEPNKGRQALNATSTP
jgi:predicted small lipoprotein YifL